MKTPDVLGLDLNDARREIRSKCPNLSIVVKETHSRKEPEFRGIEESRVIRQAVVGQEIHLLVAFFGDVYTDKIKRSDK